MASKSHWSASAEVTGTDAYATSTLSHQATSPAPQIILTFCPRGLSTLFIKDLLTVIHSSLYRMKTGRPSVSQRPVEEEVLPSVSASRLVSV